MTSSVSRKRSPTELTAPTPWWRPLCQVRIAGFRPFRAATGRSRRVRIRIADAAQAISDALAALARALQNGESG